MFDFWKILRKEKYIEKNNFLIFEGLIKKLNIIKLLRNLSILKLFNLYINTFK